MIRPIWLNVLNFRVGLVVVALKVSQGGNAVLDNNVYNS